MTTSLSPQLIKQMSNSSCDEYFVESDHLVASNRIGGDSAEGVVFCSEIPQLGGKVAVKMFNPPARKP